MEQCADVGGNCSIDVQCGGFKKCIRHVQGESPGACCDQSCFKLLPWLLRVLCMVAKGFELAAITGLAVVVQLRPFRTGRLLGTIMLGIGSSRQ